MAKKNSKKQTKLPPLVDEILTCTQEEIVQLLEQHALDVLNSGSRKSYEYNQAVVAMIQNVAKEGDTVELMLAAQYVATGLYGLSLGARNFHGATGQAMQMIRLSQVTLETLERYRNNRKLNSAESLAITG